MPYIVSNATETPTKIYYQDCGEGQPVVLIHGYPLSHRMWEYQIPTLSDAGYRCISYDRRGYGESEKPWDGYDYDTMSADLHELIEKLELENAVIVGFSMGGGEVARYFGQYGADRVSKAMLISAVTPFLLKTEDNPEGGLEPADVQEMKDGVLEDRPAFFDDLGKKFVNYTSLSHSISEQLLNYNQTIANFASPKASLDCITAWAETDFRADLKAIDVPVLIVHGGKDQIVPAQISAERSEEMITDSKLEMINGAPHGLNYTHTEELNRLMIHFLES